MKLEEQVTSLDISKHLKELGVRQESLFAYYRRGSSYSQDTFVEAGEHTLERHQGTSVDFPYEFIASAFTVAELGDILPDSYFTARRDNSWLSFSNIDYKPQRAETEADARGKMLIHLLENKLIALQSDDRADSPS